MLLNLTNHPTPTWSSAQLLAAATYGEVIDLPFPNITPTHTTQQISDLARQYCNDITTQYPRPITVHLMGEMTFTVALLVLLQKSGIECVASTSERVVEEKADGQKVVTFRFVQFRAYPNL